MSWRRTAVGRAGVAGGVGAMLVLSTLPPSGATSTDADVTTDQGLQPVAWSVPSVARPETSADEQAILLAISEERRDLLRASRAAERAEREAVEEAAAQEAAERKAAEEAAAQQAAEEAAQREAAPSTVVGERWTTTALNVRTAPGGSVVTTLAAGTKLAVTDRTDGSWQQVRWDGQDRWVAGEYLSTSQPAPAPPAQPAQPAQPAPPAQPAQPSTGACTHGGSIEGGLTANARAVYRAVCNRWPQITGYGGYRPGGGYHGSGRAVDVMVSGQLGWDVANWVRANAGSLGVSEVIYAQQIWTVQRASEGWRWQPDRGSATANHYDHVHVSVY